jgi:hypothetical protein
MKYLFAFAIFMALSVHAYAADSDIRQQQRQMQSDYDAAHPGNHKSCITPFFAPTGEFMGFRTVPDGDQFVGRVSRELATCRNGRQVVNNPATTPIGGNQARRRGAVSGQDQRIDYFYALNSDCGSQGYPTINIIRPPQNGAITTSEGEAHPVYAKDNERAACNLKKAPVTLVHYASKPGYHGGDSATVEVLFPLGAYRTIEYVFDVK